MFLSLKIDLYEVLDKEKLKMVTKLKIQNTNVIAALLCADFWPCNAPGLFKGQI